MIPFNEWTVYCVRDHVICKVKKCKFICEDKECNVYKFYKNVKIEEVVGYIPDDHQ